MTNDFKPAKAGGNQPRLSKEEYAEKKRAENMCKGMQDLLEDAREEGRKEMQEQLETEKKRAESIEAELAKYRKRFGEI